MTSLKDEAPTTNNLKKKTTKKKEKKQKQRNGKKKKKMEAISSYYNHLQLFVCTDLFPRENDPSHYLATHRRTVGLRRRAELLFKDLHFLF